MAIPWMIALKVIPWGDVIEHAPKVLSAARKLLERQRNAPPAPTPLPTDPAADKASGLTALSRQLNEVLLRLDQQAQAQTQLTQTVAELAEQNARLVSAVEVLRVRTRLLLWAVVILAAALAWLVWSR